MDGLRGELKKGLFFFGNTILVKHFFRALKMFLRVVLPKRELLRGHLRQKGGFGPKEEIG